MGASQYQMQENEIFLVADKLPGQGEPAYPPRYLGQKIEARLVCVNVVISGDGAILDAQVNRTDIPCNRDVGHDDVVEFENAAMQAIKRWIFLGSQICRFPAGIEPNNDCVGASVEIIPVPVRLTYVFEFSQKDGRTSVSQKKM